MQKISNLKNKIFNQMMLNGKKHTCEKILTKNFKKFQKNVNKNHLMIIKLSIINIAPTIQLRQIKKKKRKSLKEFAYVLNKTNRISVGIKYIVDRINKTNTQTLYQELILISQKKNESLVTKENKQKIALSKKKYIFFRWFH